MLEKTLESPLYCKMIQPVHPKGNQSWIFIWKDWCWSWDSNTLATCCEELTHLKRPWCWERLKSVGKGDDRGRDGWMASSTQWTWVWASSGRRWRTEKPGVLQSMGSQRVVMTEWLNNKVYSTGNYIQYLGISHNGKEYKNVYMCITESLCCTAEINTL